MKHTETNDDELLIADLAVANRILYHQNVVDGFGHVSVRSAKNSLQFLLSRSMALSLVQAWDIIGYDLDSNPVDEDPRHGYLERFIRTEIYQARPDVFSAVHSHSPSLLAFGIEQTSVKPVLHLVGFVALTSHFEIRDDFGDETDMLISSPEVGRSLARSLGCSCLALMRGHGSVVVGSSIKEAVYRADYAEINAKGQSGAMSFDGPLNFLTQGESVAATKTNSGQYHRCWELWRECVERKSLV